MPDLEELPACLGLFLPIKKVGNEVVKILLRLQNFGDFHHCIDGPPVILGSFLGFLCTSFVYTPNSLGGSTPWPSLLFPRDNVHVFVFFLCKAVVKCVIADENISQLV